ncbi:Tetratricopeptide TPR_2 repeat protein [Thermocrinis albus DSM 14484]|uniref:Tetratricopeptide TPR_2 repeat protein n=1 Tax=Thermocrinis albus (strain DSM 14484 / JCM 11386 / HI 11/12) TaxID=638303 RepID=D3SL23_THEAH|nr:tetratricopeptide repeat protein [Thermocrinis albus]ADC89453.1 Tetratricopeptide TPR_2 repeat protein [Thermocrinis albus DSM 14484]
MKGYRGVFSKMGENLLERYVEDLLKELQEKPNDVDLMMKLGVAYVRLKKIEEARNIYKKLKELDPHKAKELLDMIYEL